MANPWHLLLALAAGLALGALYFGGLWWTVRRLPRARSPHLLTLASFVARLAALGGAVVLLARWHWQLALAAMAGVLAVRILMVRRLRPPGDPAAKDIVTEP